MLIIQLSPQLHHAVKWSKVHAQEKALMVLQSFSLRISPSEYTALLNNFNDSEGKVKPGELNDWWA